MQSLDTFFDLYSYPYKADAVSQTMGEVLITGDVIPLLTPSLAGTRVHTLLPEVGLSVPFTISSGSMSFEEKWNDHVVKIEQESSSINKTMITNYMRHIIGLANRENNMILDGGEITLQQNGDVSVSSGLCVIDGNVHNFAGLQLSIGDELSLSPRGAGFSMSIYIAKEHLDRRQGLIVPSVLKTDLVESLIGQYNTLYAVMQSSYSMDYTSLDYIELMRMQIISQTPSTPYRSIHVDQRMRRPPINCYS